MTRKEIETIDSLADEIYERLDALMAYVASLEAVNKKKSPKKKTPRK
jgi:hypothetical protein